MLDSFLMTKGIDCAKACNPKFGSHDSATGPIKVFSASCLKSFQPMVPGIQTCICIKESIQEIASKKLRETSSLASAVSSLTIKNEKLLTSRAMHRGA